MPGDPCELLGLHPFASSLEAFLNSVSTNLSSSKPLEPEVKAYSDAVYFNYFDLGLSIMFTPTGGYKPSSGSKLNELKAENLVVDSIDIYNVPAVGSGNQGKPSTVSYTTYRGLPLVLALSPGTVGEKQRPDEITVAPSTTGKDFVSTIGEPDRKGGGAGPSSGSIGIWCEWSKDGIMVEFGGDQARGPQAWERGKDAVWKVMTIFKPKAA